MVAQSGQPVQHVSPSESLDESLASIVQGTAGLFKQLIESYAAVCIHRALVHPEIQLS